VSTNVAKGKAAAQSSTHATQAASRAVDGNQSGDNVLDSVSHTNSESQAYWQVDLGSAANLSEIVLWNRTDCCADRLANFHVLVSDTPFSGTSLARAQGTPGVTGLHFAGVMGQTGRFALSRTGRYVRVQLEGTNYLQLAEVEVFGAVLPNRPPTGAITSPTGGSTFTTPASIAINANASDPDGNLARVEFYKLSTLLGTDTAAPFTYTWANVAAGSYTVTARAFDTAGLNTSASVVVTVTSAVTSTIVHNNSSKCADISGSSTVANAAAILYTCSGGANQRFQFRPIVRQTGVYNSVATHSNLCLTVQNGSTADNTPIVQTACGTSNSQRFSAARQSNGTYRITPLIATSKAFRLRNGSTGNNTPIVIFTWYNYGSQQHRINGLPSPASERNGDPHDSLNVCSAGRFRRQRRTGGGGRPRLRSR